MLLALTSASASAQGPLPAAAALPSVEAPLPAPGVLRPLTVGLSANETHPEIKRVASKAALALTTYDAGEPFEAVAARLGPMLDAKGAAENGGQLHQDGCWSRGRIVYAQFGGLLPDRASVMVVVAQSIGAPDGIRHATRTLDIRLVHRNGKWLVAEIASVGGEPVPDSVDPSPEAVAVLEDPRIELSDSARWDILAGRASPALLRLMSRLAEHTPFGVVTLSSGHPREIFGTDRESDHARGRAVDIYRLGEALVIDERQKDSATRALVAWLYAQPEVARIGSPWVLSGFSGVSFSDALHQDHVHVAVGP